MWLSPLDKINLELETDDLLVSEGGDVGRSCLWKNELEHCYIQNSVNRVRSSGRDSTQYLYYWMSTIKAKGYIDILCNKSTIAHFTAEKVAAVPVPFPPSEEQTAIANFLDAETAKIDALVSEQRRLIDLLKEKRQAVISHAVTKGLNPDAPLKDSGIEWLGDVPEHWRIMPVIRLAKDGHKTFTDGDWIERPYVTDTGVRLLQTGNIGIGKFKEQGFRYISNETFENLKCTEVSPRDVLICRLDGPVGRACLAPDLGVPMITSVDNAILKVADDIYPDFIADVFTSLQWLSWIEALCRVGGGFRLRISRSMLGNQRVPVPPYDEQVEIAKFIDEEQNKTDTLAAEAEQTIKLLQERRTALISAAVTGKIDVREYSAQKIM